MSSIADRANDVLSHMYLDGGTLQHKLSDTLYDIACFIYRRRKTASNVELDELIAEFKPNATEEQKAGLRNELRRAMKRYGCAYDEFFLYGFENRSDAEQAAFLSDVDRLKYASILNNREKSRIFKHKWKAYQTFERFFGRKVILAKDIDEEFIARFPQFVHKQEDGSRGRGVCKIDSSRFDSVEAIKATIPNWDQGICEEIIDQDDRVKVLHPESINTVRIFTLRKRDGSIVHWRGSLRMGRGASFVDNAWSGGVFADIDCKTGVLTTVGFTERDERFTHHPDSGIEIKGFQIPDWEELLKTSTAMAQVLPDVRYVGWDMALSKSGWVMVEGNSFAQVIMTQTACKEPLKDELLEIIKDC